MPLRFENQNDPHLTLSLTAETWFGLLSMAEENGWNPMGTVVPDIWVGPQEDPGDYFYDRAESWDGLDDSYRLVLLEDALNLADALEEAFLDYEPDFVPASYFYFEPLGTSNHRQPSLGALIAAIDFCRLGAFWIGPHRPHRWT